jgi:phytoene dehydrogenase-like protein
MLAPMGWDALVVGSGPNGLAAAITLAKAGRRVLVLEAAERAGGAVASEELTLPGFVHDTFSSVYPAGAASRVFAEMRLERHGLRWVHPQACMAHPLEDGRAAVLYRDVERTAASLDELHMGDGGRWARFASPLLAHFEALRGTMLAGFPPLAGTARLAAGLGGRGMLELARVVAMPAQALAEELFEGDGGRAWLYGSALHSDAPLQAAGSAIAAVYMTLLGHAVGWPSPEGGAGRLAGAALPERYGRALRRYRPGPATLKLDWALDGPIPWSAERVGEAGTVHVGGPAVEVLQSTTWTGGLPERPSMLLGQQSLADGTRAPAGKHTAWAYTHGPQGVDWASEQERHVERMEAQVERFAPGFRDRILARHVLGPAELQARNANLVGGDVGGGSYALDQLLFRPVASPIPYRTPLRGLYIGSAATFPGGAVHGVPGRAAARAALAEERMRRLLRGGRRRPRRMGA